MDTTKADKVQARKARKRAYLRQFMQGYRVKVKDATLLLREQVTALEAEYARRSFPTMMPWHEVADALQTERSKSETEAHQLRRKLRSVETQSRVMQQWVVAHLAAIPRSPDAAVQTWRNVTLLKDPTSRQLGKYSILQQMYHNTDRMFASHGFSAIASMQAMYEMDAQASHTNDAECMYYHAKRQMESAPPDAIMRFMYRHHLCRILMADGDIPVTYPTVQEQTKTMALHQLTNSKGEWFNVLVGDFSTPTRCVVVAQQIHDDEAYGMVGSRQRTRMLWYDFEYIASAGRWMYRTLYINSQTFVRDGTLSPLSVEANDFDMPKHMHPQDEAAFRRQAKTHIQHIYDLSCDTFRQIYMHMLLAGTLFKFNMMQISPT